MAEDLDLYLQQWLKTATDNVVIYSHAFLTDRLVFTCRKCFATAKCDRPKDSNTIDYYIREFVNLHAHKGGHDRLIDQSPRKQKVIEDQMEKYKTEIKLQKQKQEIQEDPKGEIKAYPGNVIDIQTGLDTKSFVSVGGAGGSWRTNPHTGAIEWVSPAGAVQWFPTTVNPNPNKIIPFPAQTVPYAPVPAPPPKEKALKPKTGRRFR